MQDMPLRVMVAAGQDARARRRAQRGRVHVVVAQAVLRELVDVRRADRRAEAAELPEAGVVEHDEQHVRRARLRALAARAKPGSTSPIVRPRRPGNAAPCGYSTSGSGSPPLPVTAPPLPVLLLLGLGFSPLMCAADGRIGLARNSSDSALTARMRERSLAGLRYTRFHTTALCSPTRAALLTGRNHHSCATGTITELGDSFPGYTGQIPKSCAMVAESRSAGRRNSKRRALRA